MLTGATRDYHDAAGHLTSSVYLRADGSLYQQVNYGYDGAGHLASTTTTSGDGTATSQVSVTGQPFATNFTSFNAQHQTVSSVYQKADGSLYQQVSYGYDSAGHLAFTNTTNSDGTTTSLVPVSGNPNYTSTFTLLDASGHVTNQVYTRADGSTYQSVLSYADGTRVSQTFDTGNNPLSKQIDRPDGSHEIAQYLVKGQSYVSSDTLYDSAFNPLVSQFDHADGSHLIQAFVAGQHLYATSGSDVLMGAGQDTFVFQAGFGSDRIGNFDVNSDTVQLSGITTASGLQAALASAHDDASGNAVVTFNAHDTLTFVGIHTAQLQQHAGDFLLA